MEDLWSMRFTSREKMVKMRILPTLAVYKRSWDRGMCID